LGSAESNRILESWLIDPDVTQFESPASEVTEALENSLDSLRKSGYEPSVIIGKLTHTIHRIVSTHGDFLPDWSPDCEKIDVFYFTGTYQGIPVFRQSTHDNPFAFVIDLARFGEWIDFDIANDDPKNIDISVSTVSDERIKEIWPRDADAIGIRRDWVEITVFDRFRYQILDPSAAIKINFV